MRSRKQDFLDSAIERRGHGPSGSAAPAGDQEIAELADLAGAIDAHCFWPPGDAAAWGPTGWILGLWFGLAVTAADPVVARRLWEELQAWNAERDAQGRAAALQPAVLEQYLQAMRPVVYGR